MRANACRSPATTVLMPPSHGTLVGFTRFTVSPRPSCPNSLRPMVDTVPSLCSATMNLRPAATIVTSWSPGIFPLMLGPSPLPNEVTVPSVCRHRVISQPTAIWMTSVTGSMTGKTVPVIPPMPKLSPPPIPPTVPFVNSTSVCVCPTAACWTFVYPRTLKGFVRSSA